LYLYKSKHTKLIFLNNTPHVFIIFLNNTPQVFIIFLCLALCCNFIVWWNMFCYVDDEICFVSVF